MITFITGGARSGKSAFALREASVREGKRAYIATAQALDDEMLDRINRHRLERGPEWDTYEVPVDLYQRMKELLNNYAVVLVDCLTLWISNVMLAGMNVEEEAQKFIGALEVARDSQHVYVVSNEVGMGIVPDNESARRFRDLAGNINKSIAEVSDEVFITVSGIPVRIKGEKN